MSRRLSNDVIQIRIDSFWIFCRGFIIDLSLLMRYCSFFVRVLGSVEYSVRMKFQDRLQDYSRMHPIYGLISRYLCPTKVSSSWKTLRHLLDSRKGIVEKWMPSRTPLRCLRSANEGQQRKREKERRNKLSRRLCLPQK